MEQRSEEWFAIRAVVVYNTTKYHYGGFNVNISPHIRKENKRRS
jgi:hypothetical protein